MRTAFFRLGCRRPVFAGTFLALLGLTGQAQAADHTLAVSNTHKVRILAEGGTGWCREHLVLRMELQPGSPLSGDPSAQVALMNRLKVPLATDCGAAVRADLEVVAGGRPAGAYRAAAAEGWMFAPVARVAGPPPANLDDVPPDGSGHTAPNPFQNPAFLAMSRDAQEKVLGEGATFEQSCRSRTIYAAKHDCACLSRHVMEQRLNQGPSKSTEQLFEGIRNECIDPAALAGYARRKCVDAYAGLYPGSLEALCDCYADRFTKAYIKKPNDTTKGEIVMGGIVVESCRKTMTPQ